MFILTETFKLLCAILLLQFMAVAVIITGSILSVTINHFFGIDFYEEIRRWLNEKKTL